MRSFVTLFVALSMVVGGYFGADWLFQNIQFARAQHEVQATREQLAKIEDLATVFRHVGKVVEPSVVNIDVRKRVRVPTQFRVPPGNEDMFRRFFDRDGDGQPDTAPEGDMQQSGTGSGVIVEVEDGSAYIVTNNHVAGSAEELVITLYDGRKITEAEVIGADPKTDLAVIRIKTDKVVAAQWGDSSELQRGDWVLAFGSPFGYVGSMTAGIVSALDRNTGVGGGMGILGRDGYENFIQTDAAINPGNSGGPLVNIHGDVVGINTAIASRSGGFQGIGFAIPSNEARLIYENLKNEGQIVRGWLGVAIADVSMHRDLATTFGYEGTDGVFVQEIFPNTPSFGILERGDIITKADGATIQDVQKLRWLVAKTKPGTVVKFEVFRDGSTQTVDLEIGQQPDDLLAAARGSAQPGRSPRTRQQEQVLGMAITNVTDELATQFELSDQQRTGALIAAVLPDSPAARAGILPGDRITEVGVVNKPGRIKVETAEDFHKALENADLKQDGIRVYVESRVASRYVVLKAE